MLPITHKEKYEAIGIKPPKGCLMYGPPGTGKTLMARACAAQCNATFLKLAGPQLVQVCSSSPPPTHTHTHTHTTHTPQHTHTVCARLCPWHAAQMFIGDGAKLVRDAFALAKEKSPAIIFVDELDAIGTKVRSQALT